MYDFESLVAELLKERPELSREELSRRIADKKEKVGAGYLTDQGALFLVAGELGVALQNTNPTPDLPIRDLYIGANDVTVTARVLAVYPVSTYTKKDGSEGRYRRLVLFDGPHSVKLTVWDDRTEDIEKLGVMIDTPVRVVNGYVKQGLDGKPNLSLGQRGSMAVMAEDEAKLAKLMAVAERLPKLQQEKAFVALEMVVDSEPRFSEFVRSDGTPGSLFQFGATGEHGGEKARVVIWSPTSRPDLKPGQKVIVTSVRSRRSTSGEFEIHGDAGSAILPGRKAEPVQLRIVAAASSRSALVLLGLDSSRRVRIIEVGRDLAHIENGDVVTVTADEVTGGRLICKSPGSIAVEQGKRFPGLKELATKLKDAKDETAQIMVEVIALSPGGVDEVRVKDGSTVKKGELVVGDDTAELRVVGWRELAEKVSGIQPGERLRISGVSPKPTRMGGWELQLGPLAVLERLRGRD